MKKLLLPLLLLFGPLAFAQTKMLGFSTSGEINATNSGGMIWQMNPDGSDFQTLKNFYEQKPVAPTGKMVVAADGNGYAFAEGYGLDAGKQVFYQFDFASKAFTLIKVYSDLPWSTPILLGQDGALYACRKITDQQSMVCRISYDGEVEDELYSLENEGDVTGIIQAPDGKIVVTLQKSVDEIWIYSGNPDGSDWKNLAHFEPNLQENYISNLVAQGQYIYGATWQYFSQIHFFKMRTDGQDFSIFQTTSVPDFGDQISLAAGANDKLYALTQKASSQVFYQIPTDNQTTPIQIFEDTAHGYLENPLTNDAAGNFYYHAARISGNSQTVYLLKIAPGASQPQVLVNLTSSTSAERYLDLLVHPTNDRLYCWRRNMQTEISNLMTCKTNGTGLSTLYTLTSGLPEVGSSPKALIQASDHKFYGLLSKGGLNGTGLIFSMKSDGSAYEALYSLPPATNPPTVWYAPTTTFFEGSDGLLYGSVGDGNAFRMQKNGEGFSVIHSNFRSRANFMEHSDGKLYFGGPQLMRMNKDGTDQTVLIDPFLSPFYDVDFCQLFSLPNGKIAGAGSYTLGGGCLDEYTHPLCFAFDPETNALNDLENYYTLHNNTMVGSDGNLYYGKGKYNPASNQVNDYTLGCSVFPDVPSDHFISTPVFQAKNGLIYGEKALDPGSSDGRWLPMAWSAENGNCEMSVPWDVTMGYQGQFAFEVTTPSSPTLQPVLEEGITLSPNPTSTSAQLSVDLKTPTALHISVLDILGRQVFEFNQTAAAGAQTFEIPASALSTKGVYHVVLKSETGTWSRLLSVQ